jgi:hypothetical protein
VPARGSRGPIVWPLVLIIAGVALLLNNFLLLSGFNLTALWPLLLVVAGAQVLLRGDLIPRGEGRPFGITRGSVESATLEVSAGEIDVNTRALQREGRLISGQFAADSRPDLQVTDTHAVLNMNRAATPWLSFADWELGLSPDLPWQLYMTSHLGQLKVDLSGLIIAEGVFASGVGDIRLTCPQETFGPIHVQSALGNIHINTPDGGNSRIHARKTRLFNVHVDELHYDEVEPGVYVSRDSDEGAPQVEITISGTFGDAYLT